MRFMFLRVGGQNEFPLGAIHEPAEIPELLRHVAEYYEDNPDDCDSLFALAAGPSPLHFIDPGPAFGSSSAVSPATRGGSSSSGS